MQAQLLILAKGAKVMESLTAWCEKNAVTAASIQGLGTIENAEIGYYDLPTKTYLWKTIPEASEVVSLVGNVALKDGKPFVHAHVALSDSNCTMLGGHLKEATVAVTLECTILPLQQTYERTMNEGIGLFLMQTNA